MAADEELSGHEIAGEDVNLNPILPPITDPADTCDAYAEIEYAGDCAASGYIPLVPLFEPGDSCDAYAEVEYAGECVNPDAIFDSLPGSSVEEFDTSRGRLGCGTPTVFITSRCSGQMTCQIELSDIIRLNWTRVLSDVSEAEVEIGLTGDSELTCCQCLAEIEPFCHELHIWRDGDEVWVGPIEAIRYERERVTIKARDSLAWMDVRIPSEDVDFETNFTGTTTGADLTSVATTITSAGFASLPAVVAQSPEINIVLEPNTANREVVRVVTHVGASTSLTVVRGQHGTAGTEHVSGSAWRQGGLQGSEEDLSYLAQTIVYLAFEQDILDGNTCEVTNMHVTKTGSDFKYYQEAFNQTYLEILINLAQNSAVNVTALGRTIVINGSSLGLTPLGLLNDEHIMGDIEITKDGKIMGNRYWVHWDGDAGIPAVYEKPLAERYCYGLIERIRDGGGLQLEVDAQETATAYVNASFIAPRVVEIPDGSKLSPDTPWTINQLVPGARVDVSITRLCLNLVSSFLLTGVSVEYSNSDGESIGVSLVPKNSTS